MTFPEMKSILLNCLPRLRAGVLHVPQVISSFDNTQDLIEINLRRYNCLYQLHADQIVSLDLDLKMQFGNSLFILGITQKRKGMSEFNSLIPVVSCAEILCWSFLERINYFSFDLCVCSEFAGLFLVLLG